MSDSGYRAHMREILDWLKSDLFEECPVPASVGETVDTRAFRNSGGWVVLVSRRQDRTGCSGGVIDPEGKLIHVTSRLDSYTLDRMIP